jgi:hypothetical protein
MGVLVIKILSPDPMWKRGILSEREVTETFNVQLPAFLPYWQYDHMKPIDLYTLKLFSEWEQTETFL